MSVKTKDEIMNTINTIIGENPSDEALALLGDVSDTIDNYENNQRSADDVDREWREKYRQRFFSNDDTDDDFYTGEPTPKSKPKTFEDLFKEE